ncbi:MAG: 16S rRNA (uracil(1498)-N(3))-methyltransferase [Desulfobacteraceae bacterium]|nr:MAG: 16S rRNA (uracil(1498)-N(3))-methyltransferase [Desulfobacteraceae bacterium]
MRLFFIEESELSGPNPAVRGVDARHIINVLRLKPGERIGLFDGTGKRYDARIASLSSAKVEVSLLGSSDPGVESPLELVVAQSFLKEGKMDDLVRKLTELGISRWIPFISERSVPRPDDERVRARTKRWEKIAKEAAKQCKRVKITGIGKTVSFEEVITSEKDFDLKIVFWENEKNLLDPKILVAEHDDLKKILVMFGPEGGFSVNEIEKAKESGFITVSIGPRILKAETAAICASALMQFLFGDMGKNLDKDGWLK